MSELPKRKRTQPNAAAQALDSGNPVGTKNDIAYFEDRYLSCMEHADNETTQGNKSQARAWKARALECALYLSTVYTILDGEKSRIWQNRMKKLQASIHREPVKNLNK